MNTDVLIGTLSRVIKLREEMWKDGKENNKVSQPYCSLHSSSLIVLGALAAKTYHHVRYSLCQ